MTETSTVFLIVVIVLALIFDFANGFNDAANAIATVVSTRVLSPILAVVMAASLNLVGALSGTAVAKVVGKGIISPEEITLTTIAAAVAAAAVWVFLASRLGMPVSGSHSLIAGLVGAAFSTAGLGALQPAGIRTVLLGLFFAPLIGFSIGYLVMLGLYWVLRRRSPSLISGAFGRLQILSAAAMAFSHGSNDAQKTMGVVALALFVGGAIDTFHIPLWVKLLSALVMALGTYAGGWRVVRTLGVRIVKMQPIHGFAAESAAAFVIEAATRLGFPLSTTHVISSTIMGQGGTRRLSAVRWGVVRGVVMGWIVTFPFCILLGAAFEKLGELFL
ncbi:MAG: inorganic phosphate transporter [Chloroflexi bacterium]|nr:inorganic phosphate transporter [Chloroflexota bacterium]